MMGFIHPVLAACLTCGIFLSLPARAQGGRVTFSGAIVVPTCSSQLESPVGMVVSGPVQRFACGTSPGGAVHSNYRLSVTELDATKVVSDPLLHYFAGSGGTSQVATTRMLTRTYE